MHVASSHRRQRCLSFSPGTDAPVALGLDFTRQALAEWHLTPTSQAPYLPDDALLVVGELLANACRHGRGPRELRLTLEPGHLHVAVSDHNTAPPIRRNAGPEATSGHGIPIVEHLATWGTEVDSEGKTVWADLPTTSSNSASPPQPGA